MMMEMMMMKKMDGMNKRGQRRQEEKTRKKKEYIHNASTRPRNEGQKKRTKDGFKKEHHDRGPPSSPSLSLCVVSPQIFVSPSLLFSSLVCSSLHVAAHRQRAPHSQPGAGRAAHADWQARQQAINQSLKWHPAGATHQQEKGRGQTPSTNQRLPLRTSETNPI